MLKPYRRTAKLSVLTKDKQHITVQITADERTLSDVKSCRASYKAILGHEVSTAVIARRALSMLATYLRQVKDEAVIADELAYLMRACRG